MNCEYFCEKMNLEAMKIEMAQIFFSNGDFFTLNKREIADVAVAFYDELRVGECGFCPVAKSGFLKCKISAKDKHKEKILLYENNEYDNRMSGFNYLYNNI